MENILSYFFLVLVTAAAQAGSMAKNPSAVMLNPIEAKVGTHYKGDGLRVTPTEFGARLHCAGQYIEADATTDGLWLTSTVAKQASGRFQVKAVAADRRAGRAATRRPLSQSGTVAVAEQTVQFSRTGLLEEYTVSLDGLRQDFIVQQRPAGEGALLLELSVSGARVEPVANGARLVLEGSGRKIDYGRLRAMDAQGRELSARLRVTTEETRGFEVVVDDGQASYPVRIDPTFTDANWVDIGGIGGAGDSVDAAVIDGSGNLYIGGFFTVVGNVKANYVAKWDGTNWSALGSGLSSYVYALAVSGTNLYAGGWFTAAGGARRITSRNGTGAIGPLWDRA